MNVLNEILSPERTVCRAPATSKKRLFETIARIISDSQPDLAYETIFSELIAREKLGSTGLGHGIAIPHCRMNACQKPLGTLLSLDQPVDFDAPDDQPVDLLFALLVPAEANQQHLDILANIARLFSQHSFCERLRFAKDNRALFDAATAQDE